MYNSKCINTSGRIVKSEYIDINSILTGTFEEGKGKGLLTQVVSATLRKDQGFSSSIATKTASWRKQGNLF